MAIIADGEGPSTDVPTPTLDVATCLENIKHYQLMVQAYYTTTAGRTILGKATVKREYGAYLQFLECLDLTLGDLYWIIESRPDVVGGDVGRAQARIMESRLFTEGKLDTLSTLAATYADVSTAYNNAVKESHITQS